MSGGPASLICTVYTVVRKPLKKYKLKKLLCFSTVLKFIPKMIIAFYKYSNFLIKDSRKIMTIQSLLYGFSYMK